MSNIWQNKSVLSLWDLVNHSAHHTQLTPGLGGGPAHEDFKPNYYYLLHIETLFETLCSRKTAILLNTACNHHHCVLSKMVDHRPRGQTAYESFSCRSNSSTREAKAFSIRSYVHRLMLLVRPALQPESDGWSHMGKWAISKVLKTTWPLAISYLDHH